MIAATVASATTGRPVRMASATAVGRSFDSDAISSSFVRREQKLPVDSRRKHRYLCSELDNSLDMTTTVPQPAPARPRLALRDRVLRLAELVTTPLLPSDYLDLIDPLRSGADLRGRIEAVQHETRDAATVVIRPGRGWRTHKPGQYIRIGIDVDGVRQWRAYSVTSDLGRSDGCITITVKAIPD